MAQAVVAEWRIALRRSTSVAKTLAQLEQLSTFLMTHGACNPDPQPLQYGARAFDIIFSPTDFPHSTQESPCHFNGAAKGGILASERESPAGAGAGRGFSATKAPALGALGERNGGADLPDALMNQRAVPQKVPNERRRAGQGALWDACTFGGQAVVMALYISAAAPWRFPVRTAILIWSSIADLRR